MKAILIKGIIFAAMIGASDAAIAWFFKNGLYKYMGLDKTAKVLCIGHSHTMEDIDEEVLSAKLGVPVSKYALCGMNAIDRLAMLKHYFDEHQTKDQIIVYDVDHLLLNGQPGQSNAYRQLYPFMDNANIGSYVRDQAKTWEEFYAKKILRTTRYGDTTRNVALRGYLGIRAKAYSSRANIANIRRDILQDKEKYRIKIHRESIDALMEAIILCQQHKARIVLAFYPTMDLVNRLEPEKYAEILKIYEDIARKNPDVTFLNFNVSHDKDYGYFYDATHMNRDGQLMMTEELGNEIKKMLKSRN